MGKKGNSSKNEKISKLRDQYGITIKQAKIIIEKYKGSVDDFYKKYKNDTITDTEEMELGACILMKEYGISVYDIPRSHVKKIIEKYGSVDSFYEKYISGSITDEEEQKLASLMIKDVANIEGIPDSPYDSLYKYISESFSKIPRLRIYSIERLKAIIDKIDEENKPLGKYTYKEILEARYDLEGFWKNKYKDKDEYYDEDKHKDKDKDDSESSEEKQKHKKYKEIREDPNRRHKLMTIKNRLLEHPINIQYSFLFEIISDEDKKKMKDIIKDIQLQNGDFHENMELLYSIINEKKSEIIHYFDGLNFDYRIIERLLNGHPEIKDRVKARSVIKDILSKNEDLDKRVKYGRYTIGNLLKAFSINIARIEYLGFEHDQAKIIASMIIDGLLVSKGKDEFLKMNFCELMRMEDDYLWNESKGGNKITVEDAIKLEDISLNPYLVEVYGADIREICGLILQFLAFEISDIDMLKIPKLSGDDLAKIAEKLRDISYGLDDGKYVIHRGREDDE